MNDLPRRTTSTDEAGPGSGLSAADRVALRALLLADVARAEEQAAALSSSFATIVEAAELVNTDDEHDPEGTTIAYERAQVGALLRQAESDVESLHAALSRLDDDVFGLCEGCAQPIGIERLHAIPASTRCVRCA